MGPIKPNFSGRARTGSEVTAQVLPLGYWIKYLPEDEAGLRKRL